MKDFVLSFRYIRLRLEKGSCMSQLKFGSPTCLQILIFCNTTFLLQVVGMLQWRVHVNDISVRKSAAVLYCYCMRYSVSISYFNLIANVVAFIRYFLSNQCYVKRDMGSRAQRHTGRVGIIYLEMNNMQLSLKANPRVFFFPSCWF